MSETSTTEVAWTFTSQCAWGCAVHTRDGKTQPHTCDGASRITDLFTSHRGDSWLSLAEHIAEGLAPRLRELRGKSWDDGVSVGRSGIPVAGDLTTTPDHPAREALRTDEES